MNPRGSEVALTRVSILGAGAEGCWLALRAARAGYQVTLEDLMPGRRRAAAERLRAAAEPPEGRGGGSADLRHPILFAESVEQAAREADLVIDFVPDELESKLEIFSLLDRMAPPHTIFATPTRTLSIADLASCTYRAERCVALVLPAEWGGAAPFEVEVVHAASALPEVVERVAEFWASLGASVTAAVDRVPVP